MSSYYPSFSYTTPNGKNKYNSYKDKNLIVVHFESGDQGEVDTFLGMDCVYSDNAYGTRRFDYGAKYNSVAVIRISVMKANGKDFTVSEVRDFLRWTTGSRRISYLDLEDNNGVCASFLGRITAVYQQKLDARTIGFVIEHTSVSPWAYSPTQYIGRAFGQVIQVVDDGVLVQENMPLIIDYNNSVRTNSGSEFSISDNGIAYIDNTIKFEIDNLSDDLSSYVYLDTIFTNNTSDHVFITNKTLYEESNGRDGITSLSGIHAGEVITLSAEQFITSSSGRMLGNNFNFVWPRLLPGINEFIIDGSGEGFVQFAYRYPIKIGDCAIDISVYGNEINDGDCPDDSGSVSTPITWDDILNKPSTIQGYGITDSYTIVEVNNKININENELNKMLETVLE